MNGVQKQIDYWRLAGHRNFKTTQDLYKTKHYDACLFFCHLALEKLLKGLVVQQTKQPAPYIHDLAKLSKLAGLNVSPQQLKDLRMITTFNIAGRYDDVKFAFYKQCTPAFTKLYFTITQQFVVWLEQEYRKK